MKFNDYWFPPKKTKTYFSPNAEKELKQKYKGLYTLHTIVSCIIPLIPIIGFFLLIPKAIFDPIRQSNNLIEVPAAIIGLIGSVAIGVGFNNIFMALIKQYLGHLVTIATIVGGMILSALSIFLFRLAV